MTDRKMKIGILTFLWCAFSIPAFTQSNKQDTNLNRTDKQMKRDAKERKQDSINQYRDRNNWNSKDSMPHQHDNKKLNDYNHNSTDSIRMRRN